jgi:hypothetical protein
MPLSAEADFSNTTSGGTMKRKATTKAATGSSRGGDLPPHAPEKSADKRAVRRGPDGGRQLSKLLAQVNGSSRFSASAIEDARLRPHQSAPEAQATSSAFTGAGESMPGVDKP